MTITDAVRILRAHNAWRRDETGELAQQDPREIGEAIDVLCCFVDSDEIRHSISGVPVRNRWPLWPWMAALFFIAGVLSKL